MLRGLRFRLAALFTALTGLVLAAALFWTYRMAAGQYAAGQQALHQAALSGLAAQLSQGRVSDAWLAQLETQGPYLVFVEDGGQPLAFAGAWRPATARAELWRQWQEQAMGAGAPEGFVLLGGAGERYAALSISLRPGGRSCRAALLRPLAGQRLYLRRLAAQYLALGLAGLAALALASWALTGLALRPTRRALRRQTEFVAAASHELRGPLAVITASLQAAREAPGLEGEALLAAAGRESARMARLVDDLLCLARADAQPWPVRNTPTDLDTLCVELFERCAPLAAQGGRRFVLDLPDEPLPPLFTDPERLVQLLGIFVDNALAYSPAGTAVTLSVRATSRRVRLAVLDEGPGIPVAQRERIWERFYRGDPSRSSKQHAGLGLAVAKELARALGARLTVGSAPGGGAAFCAEFPLG